MKKLTTSLLFAALVTAYWARKALFFVLSLCLGAEECAVCGKPALALPLCRPCFQKRLAHPPGLAERCGKCGKVLVSESGLCMECRKKEAPSSLAFCLPVFSYRLWMKDLIFAWKIRGLRILTPVFARLINQVIQDDLKTDAVIVPVPPRPGKVRKKGWDQVEDLCRWLELAHCRPVLRLLRRRSAPEQKKLDRDAREANAGKSYYVPEGVRQKISLGKIPLPAKVLLLDDVRTTGATLETCAAVLGALGVEDVRAVVLAGVD
jgi:ComF family protein